MEGQGGGFCARRRAGARIGPSYRSWMQHKYAVRFARTDPETPPTMDEQIDLARDAARKLGIPNCESKPDVSIELPRSCDTGDTRMSDNLQNGTRFGGQHDSMGPAGSRRLRP